MKDNKFEKLKKHIQKLRERSYLSLLKRGYPCKGCLNSDCCCNEFIISEIDMKIREIEEDGK